MSGKWQGLFGVLLVAAALSALPAAAQAAGSVVTIAVPATQRIEGTISLAVSAGAPIQRGRLTVMSNVSWVLVARTGGADAQAAWKRAGDATWRPLTASTPVLQGAKGVHEIEYEVRQIPGAQPSDRPVTVTFSVEPVAAW